MKRWRWVCGMFAAAMITSSSGAAAQASPSTDALPGAWRVGLPSLGAANPRLTLAGFGGYGWIPGIGDEGGDHHRAQGSAAVSIVPVEWIAVAAGLAGFWDVHPSDTIGSDDSGFGTLFLALRGGVRLPEHFAIGADVRWDLSGADAPDIQVEASRLSLRALASYQPDGGAVTLGLIAGYRIDGSANSVGNIAEYRRGDRVSLGAASSDAVLLGLAGVIDLTAVELALETTFEPFVGGNAPPVGAAPLRFAGGARIPILPDLRAHAMLEVTAQRRLPAEVDQPLVPSEPRIALTFGITYSPSFANAPATTAEEVERVEREPVDQPPPPGPRPIRGQVLDDAGAPVAGATVELHGADGGTIAERTSDAEGRYAFDPVPPGSYQVRIVRDGYDPIELAVQVGGSGAEPVEAPSARLVEAVPAGALRGLVRDFRGTPVRAQVRVQPSGQQAETDADGMFEIEVPPGSYDVEVRAQGFVTQTRQVRVNENGVTILNVDLRRGH